MEERCNEPNTHYRPCYNMIWTPRNPRGAQLKEARTLLAANGQRHAKSEASELAVF